MITPGFITNRVIFWFAPVLRFDNGFIWLNHAEHVGTTLIYTSGLFQRTGMVPQRTRVSGSNDTAPDHGSALRRRKGVNRSGRKNCARIRNISGVDSILSIRLRIGSPENQTRENALQSVL